jgi:hypothetical protein
MVNPTSEIFRTEVALFADRSLAYEIDDGEDISSILGHLSTLSTAGSALTRILNAADGGEEIDAEEMKVRAAEGRDGVEFILSVCAALAGTARRMDREGVDHG